MKFASMGVTLIWKVSRVMVLGCLVSGFSNVSAADVASVFEQFKGVAQPAAEQLGEKIVYQFDAWQRILKVGREIQINKLRKMTQVQSVKLDDLEAEAVLEGPAGMPEPWVKIRCFNNGKRVQVDTKQSVDGAEIQELQKSEELRFLILPCHRKSLPQLLRAYAEFRKAAGQQGQGKD